MALPALRNKKSSDLSVRQENTSAPVTPAAPAVRENSLSTWDPWREMEQLNRWFDEFMNRSFAPFGMREMFRPFGLASGRAGMESTSPTLEFYETPDEVVLFAWCPGAKKDAFDITLSSANGGVITIQGERQPLIQGENMTGYGSGLARMQDKFSVSCRLPCEINPEQVTANYHDGVLEIHLAKAETVKVRRVKIPVEG
jgi:HSP20 family protein